MLWVHIRSISEILLMSSTIYVFIEKQKKQTTCIYLDFAPPPSPCIEFYWQGSSKEYQGPVVQSIVSLTSSLRVISLTVLADSIYNILIFFAEKMWVAFALQKLLTFFQQKIQHICISHNVNFNELLTMSLALNNWAQNIIFSWINKKNINSFWLKKTPYLELWCYVWQLFLWQKSCYSWSCEDQ